MAHYHRPSYVSSEGREVCPCGSTRESGGDWSRTPPFFSEVPCPSGCRLAVKHRHFADGSFSATAPPGRPLRMTLG